MSAAAILALIPLIISSIKGSVALVNALKPQVKSLFDSGEITEAQQAQLISEIEGIREYVRTGIWPSHWNLAPDPR